MYGKDLPSTSAGPQPKALSPPATPTFAHVCPKCPKTFVRKDALTRHLATHNKQVKRPQPRPQPLASVSGTKRRRVEKVSDVFTTRTIYPTQEVAEDLLLFQEEARPQIVAILEEDLTAKGPIK
ncbi:hypothetical protein JTE90_026821 [Oedothorax gibbosus]|uniref:C2H2-type domain-containing protein n=1 Tax=Oedothorax gibbosus TaxID=931172 RepID=A0AAV6V866_9ARAC|nr:hypothetical protein JTE90_026821 [Oedothorax gibbosus]